MASFAAEFRRELFRPERMVDFGARSARGEQFWIGKKLMEVVLMDTNGNGVNKDLWARIYAKLPEEKLHRLEFVENVLGGTGYFPRSARDKRPATNRQIIRLHRMGVSVPPGLQRGAARWVIRFVKQLTRAYVNRPRKDPGKWLYEAFCGHL